SSLLFCAFCFHTAPSAALYPLSLHDALPICLAVERSVARPAPARSVADVVLERALELEAAVLVPVAIEAVALAAPELAFVMDLRSEERRVGKEWRGGWWAEQSKKSVRRGGER